MTEGDPEELTLGPGTELTNRLRHDQRSKQEHAALQQFTIEAAQLLRDRYCEDVLIINVQGLSDITDYILLASGTSDRQMKAVAQEVQELAAQAKLERYGREQDDMTSWLVIDFIDVVVHLFEPTTRAHYDLEMLWGDAPRIEWENASGQ